MTAVAVADSRPGFWTPELDDRLRELAPDHSARQIADMVGASRNAVIGRCRRRKIDLASPATKIQRGPILRLPIRKAAVRIAKVLTPEYSNVEPSKLNAHCANLQRKREVAMLAPADDWQPARTALLDLRSSNCRWPLWTDATPRSERFFCGNAVVPGGSYCSHCATLAYRPRQIATQQDRKIRKGLAA